MAVACWTVWLRVMWRRTAPPCGEKLLAVFMKNHPWLASFTPGDFHILPAEFGANPGAERL